MAVSQTFPSESIREMATAAGSEKKTFVVRENWGTNVGVYHQLFYKSPKEKWAPPVGGKFTRFIVSKSKIKALARRPPKFLTQLCA